MVPKCALARSLSLTDAIQENYSKLLKWAGQITRNDSRTSEDLVQDLFLRSLQADTPAIEIENIDSYLYRSLRNSFVSGLRRESLRSETSLEEELIAQLAELSIDPRRSLRVQELLAEICYFACTRKDTSISASVLLLRYFHGYYTAEVVKVLKRPRSSIEARLANARRELKVRLLSDAEPQGSPVADNGTGSNCRVRFASTGNVIQDLRNEIFANRSGRCLTSEQYRRIYSKQNLKPTREEIGHLVSCRCCLESVNTLLKMPQLRERHPLDTRGPQSAFDFYGYHRAKKGLSSEDEF